MGFSYNVGDTVIFTNGEVATITGVKHDDAEIFAVRLSAAVHGLVGIGKPRMTWCYTAGGGFVCSGTLKGNDILRLASPTQETRDMQTVSEFIKDLPAKTRVTDGLREWTVREDHVGRFLESELVANIYTNVCEIVSIPNLHVKKMKVKKGIVIYKSCEWLCITSNNFTEQEFKTRHSEFVFLRIVDELPEFPTEEVEE